MEIIWEVNGVGIVQCVVKNNENNKIFDMNIFNKPIKPPKDYYEIFNKAEYECPNCDLTPSDEPYWNGQNWPEYYNSGSSHSDLGSFYYWEEFHKCSECNTKFWFESGN
tara:strand:- start:418 stop:744 length:327 start_codon:yes stop_codon:yes gene_type:complete